jgi:hypothetical protein
MGDLMGKRINQIANWILHRLPQDVVEQYARDHFELATEDEFCDAGAERAELRRECMG